MIEKKYIEVYGIKGFDKDLKCRNFQYEIGKTYFMEESKINICASGFHFSESLHNVFNFYSKYTKSNRYCIVKGLIPEDKYNFWTTSDKIVTNNLTVLEELTEEQIDIISLEESNDKLVSKDEIFRLKSIMAIQKAYPNFAIGGSSALYLQGFNIQRDKKVDDLDFVIPYYERMDLSKFDPLDKVTEVLQMDDAKNSGNDFDYVNGITINNETIIMDMCINPKAHYIFVDYLGFQFKVCTWEVIIKAKLNYLTNVKSGTKHRKDLLCMFGNPVHKKEIKKEETLLTKLLKKWQVQEEDSKSRMLDQLDNLV